MKVKLDENLPAGLVPVLEALGHDVETVPGEGLSGHPDSEVVAAARTEGRLLVSQDLDVADRRRMPATHPGVLLVRLRAPGARALLERIGLVFRTEALATWAGAVVVLTDSKIRVSRP